MKAFVRKFLLFAGAAFLVLEIGSRLMLDSLYFNELNTYNEKEEGRKSITALPETKHVDFLFLGSSRIPATINPALFKKLNEGKTVVNAGRGSITPGIHIEALNNKLKHEPDYLKGSIVFLEFPGSSIYTDNFEQVDKLTVYEPIVEGDRAMPHLLLPHLDLSSLLRYLRTSHNSTAVKADMTALYLFSAYRTSSYINEKFNKLNKPIRRKEKQVLVETGGISNQNLDAAIEKARKVAKYERNKMHRDPPLNGDNLDQSSIAVIHKIVVDHGGELVLFKMPLHSIQAEVHRTERAKNNQKAFENWLNTKGIRVIETNTFTFNDNDFPDAWHLGINRRDEFTTLLFEAYMEKTSTTGGEDEAK